MYRNCLNKLKKWLDAKNGKPLLLDGARQVGKTWLLLEFGRQYFKNTAYVSLDRAHKLRHTFDSCDVRQILNEVGIDTGEKILPGETLIILDEIQSIPAAITSLKYFAEEAPEYMVAAAGSLLGISANFGSGFPVGKTHSEYLYPMSFLEFLTAVGREQLAERIKNGDWKTLTNFHDDLSRLLKEYYFVGGMPKVVEIYNKGFCRDYEAVREEQARILDDYRKDFSKHSGSDKAASNIRSVWHSIPAQLSKENRRFLYSAVKEGGRGRDFLYPIEFLRDAGLAQTVPAVSKPSIPLAAYATQTFKLFGLDIGLLGAQCDLDSRTLLEGNRIYEEFKGAMTEQYVQQEIRAESGLSPFYWSAGNGGAEIDFIYQISGNVIPLEVKAENNLKAKSLKVYAEKFSPLTCVKTSMTPYHNNPGQISIPLYGISQLKDEILQTIGQSQ